MKLEKVCFLSLVVVVFLAGCAKQTSVVSGGVIIEKFTPQVSTVPSNSPVELTLIVKNTGEREASDVKAVLGGLVIGSSEQQEWGLSTGESILKPLDPATLQGEDVPSGFKGEQGIVTWRLTAPIQVRDQTYEPTINLVYDYSAVSTILIKAVDFNYFQSLPENEQKLVDTGVVVSKTTKGPIEVSVKTDQAVISGFSTLPIEIEFKNVGGGRVFLFGLQEHKPGELYSAIKQNIDNIWVKLPTGLKCSLELVRFGGSFFYKVRLIEGKNGRILCNKVIGGISTIQTLSMDIEIFYGYLLEGKTVVKVSKTLYQPPIYDISLDVIPTIKHTHNIKTEANLDFRVTNVGNQIVSVSGLKASGTINNIQSETPSYTNLQLKQFDSETKSVVSSLSSSEKELKIDFNIGGITYTDPSGAKKTEENLKNNRITKTIPLDYDLFLKDIEAEVPDTDKLNIEVTVANLGKNVIGNNIPVHVKVDDDTKVDCKSGTPGLAILNNLNPEDQKSFTCTYVPPREKETKKITAEIDKSSLESREDNNKHEIQFEFIVDVGIVPGTTKGDLLELSTTKVKYKLSTTVENKGTIKANNIKIEFKGQVDGKQTTLCPTTLDLLLPRERKTASCDTALLPVEVPNAEVIVDLADKNPANNRESFTLFLNHDPAITYLTWEEVSLGRDTRTYNFVATVKNLGEVFGQPLTIDFKDVTDPNNQKVICDSDISPNQPEDHPNITIIPAQKAFTNVNLIVFSLSPGEEVTVKCIHTAPRDIATKVKASLNGGPLEPSAKLANNERTISTSQTLDLVLTSVTLSSSKLENLLDVSMKNLGPVKSVNIAPTAEVLLSKSTKPDVTCERVNLLGDETKTVACKFSLLEEEHLIVKLTVGTPAGDINFADNERLVSVKCTRGSCQLTPDVSTLFFFPSSAKVNTKITAELAVPSEFNNKVVFLKQISPERDIEATNCENNICRFVTIQTPSTAGTYEYGVYLEGKELGRGKLIVTE